MSQLTNVVCQLSHYLIGHDWLAYLTHFRYQLEFKTMPRSHSFQRALHYACASSKFWLVNGLFASVYQFC